MIRPTEHPPPAYAPSLPAAHLSSPSRPFAHCENLFCGQRQRTPKAVVTTENEARDRRWAESPAVTHGYVEDFHRRPKARQNAGVVGGGHSRAKPVSAGEFPINRENNWEYLDFWVFWPKLAVRNDRVFSVLRRKFPKPRNRELFSTNWELFWWNREF